MKYKQLGRTGLYVSEICLGAMTFGGYARFETLQAYYSLAGRDLEREYASLIAEERLGLMVWSPLAGGLLSGKYEPGGPADGRRAKVDFPTVDHPRASRCIAVMAEIAQAQGCTLPQVALAWVLSRPMVMSAIIGVRTLAQLDDNLGAVGVELTSDELETLDAVSALTAEYPNWLQAYRPPRSPAAYGGST